MGYSIWIGYFKSHMGPFDLYFYSIFAAKILRAFQVANNVRLKTPYLTLGNMLIFVGALFFVNFILLIVYYSGGGAMDAVVVQSSTNFLYNYISCRIEDLQFQGVMFVLFYLFNGLFTLVIAVFAINCRKVESPFGEIKFISFALYDQLIVLIVIIIIYYSGTDGTDSASRQYILRSLGVLFVLYITLALISIPKLYYIYKTQSEIETEFGRKSGDSDAMFGTSTQMYTEATTNTTSAGFMSTSMASASSSPGYPSSYSGGVESQLVESSSFSASEPATMLAGISVEPDTMYAGDRKHVQESMLPKNSGNNAPIRKRQVPIYDPDYELSFSEDSEDAEYDSKL
jgi:hypothetical protein